MAGAAPEGSQYDARPFDEKMKEQLGTEGGEEFFTSYDEFYDSFDPMVLQENLLREIYAHGFQRPSAIQQRGIDVIQQAQSETETGKKKNSRYRRKKKPMRSVPSKQ